MPPVEGERRSGEQAGRATRRAPPSNRLPREARTVWRLAAALNGLPLLLGAHLASGFLADREDLARYRHVPWLLVAALAIVFVVVLPELRWRRWRWEIHAHEIDIQRGGVSVTRTLVPIARVQHVDTEEGVLQRTLDLATVVVHTAAGRNEIPQLGVLEAHRVRDRIAELTRAPGGV
jgi:hypothetical protein